MKSKPKKGGLKSSDNTIRIDPALGRRLTPQELQAERAGHSLEQVRQALLRSLAKPPAAQPQEPPPRKPQLSTGNFSPPSTEYQPPISFRWVTVRWESEHGYFDPASLRLEPETCEFDELHQPYTWPRVYLPNGLPATSTRGSLTALELVALLNEKCNWQTPRPKIADIVERYGGGIRFPSVSFSKEHTGDGVPDERFRKAVTTRRRSRTRATAGHHAILQQVVRLEQQQHLPFPPPQEPHVPVAKTFQPVPVSEPYLSDARAHGVSENEIREYVGLPTLEQQIVHQMEKAHALHDTDERRTMERAACQHHTKE